MQLRRSSVVRRGRSLWPPEIVAGLLLLAVLGVETCWSDVLRVPSEYPTIQAAFNAVATDDTVLVDAGLYAEALIAPRERFHFIGNAEGNSERPIVDASLTPDSVRRGCLRLPHGSEVTVERIIFRNLFDIWPRTPHGGVELLADTATFRHCAFDSTRTSVWHSEDSTASVRLEFCTFNGGFGPHVWLADGELHAVACLFDGGIGICQVACGSGSRILNCTFKYPWLASLQTDDADVEIEGCVFGPTSSNPYYTVVLSDFAGRFHHNLFIDLLCTATALEISAKCEEDVRIVGNTFVNLRMAPNHGAAPCLAARCRDDLGGPMIINSNVFVACSLTALVKGAELKGQGRLTRNRFADMIPDHVRTVWVDSGTFEFRENLFQNTGIALNTSRDSVDARWNWWGHETGPYHPTLNPNGQGDEVGDNVLFDPWHADTSFLNVPDPRPLRPTQYGLSVYPNPFNSQARFRMELLEAGVYEIELFDIRGRRVTQVFKGPAAYRYELQFDASQLSSGVYFARMRDVITNRLLATTKLLVLR